MADLDLTALRRQAKAADPLMPAMTLHTDTVLALLDRVEKAENEATRALDILSIAQIDAHVANSYRGDAEAKVASLRSLLARAGEALRPFASGLIFDADYSAARTIAREIEEALR